MHEEHTGTPGCKGKYSSGLPKNKSISSPPDPIKMILFGKKRILTDVIKNFKMRSSQIILVDAKPKDICPCDKPTEEKGTE